LRAVVRTLLVTALAVGLLAFFIRNADLSRVWTEMQAARRDMLVFAVVVTLAMYFVRAERWQYLLEPLGHTRFWIAFKTTVIGFAATTLLPARAGEVLRPYLLARHEGLPATATFATIIVERILDLAAVLILLAIYLAGFGDDAAAAAPSLYRAIAVGGTIMFVVTLGLIGVMFAMAGHPERLHGIVLRLERVLPERLARVVAGFARTFAQGLAIVRRPRRLVLALAWSLALWVLIAAYGWAVARAFGIIFPFAGSFLLSAMLVVGVAVPTPGGIGGVHEAFRLGVTAFFGADNNTAVGAAIVIHGLAAVMVVAGGFWFALRDGLTIGNLRKMAESEVNT
jgi:glycosyltransferase 2 family protein